MQTRRTKPFKPRVSLMAALAVGLLSSVATAAPVQVELKIIHAHNKGKVVDPKIQALVKLLQKLSFTSYTLKDEAVLAIELNAAGSMQLPNGEWLAVKPITMEADGKLKLELSVEKLKFKTTVAIGPGATLVVGGPPFDGGALIVAVSRPKEQAGER